MADLHLLGFYYPILDFLNSLWWSEFNLVSERTYFTPPGAEIFYLKNVKEYTYVDVHGLRYGTGRHSRGQKYCYAYVKDRRLVFINSIFQIQHARAGHDVREVVCAVVRPFLEAAEPPAFPWDAWCVTIASNKFIVDNI